MRSGGRANARAGMVRIPAPSRLLGAFPIGAVERPTIPRGALCFVAKRPDSTLRSVNGRRKRKTQRAGRIVSTIRRGAQTAARLSCVRSACEPDRGWHAVCLPKRLLRLAGDHARTRLGGQPPSRDCGYCRTRSAGIPGGRQRLAAGAASSSGPCVLDAPLLDWTGAANPLRARDGFYRGRSRAAAP